MQVQRLERLQSIAKKTALSSESALRDAVTQLQQLQQQHQHCSITNRSQQQHAATVDAQLQTEVCVRKRPINVVTGCLLCIDTSLLYTHSSIAWTTVFKCIYAFSNEV
jgi:hypothetical protein